MHRLLNEKKDSVAPRRLFEIEGRKKEGKALTLKTSSFGQEERKEAEFDSQVLKWNGNIEVYPSTVHEILSTP